MPQCSICGGLGELSQPAQQCGRCTGTGYEPGTGAAKLCSVCGGSGSSSKRVTNPCWNCSGTGRLPHAGASAGPSRQTPKNTQKPKPSKPVKTPAGATPHPANGIIPRLAAFGIVGVYALISLLLHVTFQEEWQPLAIAAAIGALFAAVWYALLFVVLAGAAALFTFGFLSQQNLPEPWMSFVAAALVFVVLAAVWRKIAPAALFLLGLAAFGAIQNGIDAFVLWDMLAFAFQ